MKKQQLDVLDLKYDIWNTGKPGAAEVNALVNAGYTPLTAMVLAARGIDSPEKARRYLDYGGAMPDPMAMTDMARAAARVRLALERQEKIAVFGDYDVDGITATCLLTQFLRSLGADCLPYIPSRLEEGYGLNPIALTWLHEQGIRLIVTVDCGITALEEARLCKELGMDLVITDHHECKEELPQAVAVVDPHRPDDRYPHKILSGVGVAFKLAAALQGSQEEVLSQYADMICLGTVADVMLLQGENRRFVREGLEMLRSTHRPGLAALMNESGCDPRQLTANDIGYILAPRINAAGRMGEISLAVELFLTQDPARAQAVAHALCELNRQRQRVESEIYREVVSMLSQTSRPEAIVLAGEGWHQGVVGIVASRIAEEYCCPTFLICLDGDRGKASSRSYGGFNLFQSLHTLSPLLESYGGHELAAGFTISKQNIPLFREKIGAIAGAFYANNAPRTTLQVDCAVPAELLSVPGVESLELLEPCGSGCPKPVLALENLRLERATLIGGGRHTRLRLRAGRYSLNAVFFSATPESQGLVEGDMVDAAFIPQINDYRGERTVQLHILDIHPACSAPCSPEIEGYLALRRGSLARETAAALAPDRRLLALVWKYLAAQPNQSVQESPMCLCRKIVRWSGLPLRLEQLLVCLDIFSDVRLLELQRLRKYYIISLSPTSQKADLGQSDTLQRLLHAKEG